MISVVDWLKHAKWYYLLAIAVGGLIIITIIITIIVAAVRKSRRSTRARARTQATELQTVVTVAPSQSTTTTTKKVTTITPPPLSMIPSAPPLELMDQHNNYNLTSNTTQAYTNAQGQIVQVNTTKETTQLPQNPVPSAPSLEKHRPTSMIQHNVDVQTRHQPALSNYSRKQIKRELDLAEAQEFQLGTEISLEEYNHSSLEEYNTNSAEEVEDGSQIWIEERNGASNQAIQKKVAPPEVFGPYSYLHIKAAVRIQRVYRGFIKNLEKEISALFSEQSRLITMNKNSRKVVC
eukprot:TRINITY_DN3709_c1_g1_i1.p1 TRINITY_DN3709_c1_g1~~TRINITY_DN3709_c1_g1_i1.p1  ORF type:complete len:292 (-),score=78.56 TRINITY_DN3709_c1_g1_i1:89-964(-)